MRERRAVTTAEAIAWLLDERTEPSKAEQAYMAWWVADLVEETPNAA